MRKSFQITLGVFIGVCLILNLLLDNPSFRDLQDKAEFELKANQPELAEKTWWQIAQQDSLNIDNHYRYIISHFSLPAQKKVGKNEYEDRDDNSIQLFYNAIAASKDSTYADIGHYGKGLIQVSLEHYAAGITAFMEVKNTRLKYLNNSIGYAYLETGDADSAEYHFRQEIAQNGNLRSAYGNLIELLQDQNRTAEVAEYLNSPDAKPYFPPGIARAIYFKNIQPIAYGAILFKNIFSGFNIWGAIAALLIMGSWVMYLRKLDIFEPEKWKHIIITVLLGMLFCFLTFPLSDFDNFIFDFNLNGGIINDFFYSIIGIGAIEEFVKIIPLLLMIRFTNAVNEPFDYIKYASLSALGFAFVENLIYFDESSLNIIHGRALTATVSHMFDSSIIAYGLILNRYKRGKNPYLNFLLFFALAALAHGFYDFWLLNETASALSIVTFAFLMVSMFMWNSFKNNALNHSDFFDKDKSIDSEKLQDYLFYALAGVLLFEYIAVAFKFSPGIANTGLLTSFSSGAYLLFFLSGNLSQFSLQKGLWAPIKYWQKKEETEAKEATENTFEISVKIKLDRDSKNDYAHYGYLPNTGKTIAQRTVSDEPDWYLLKLDAPKQHPDYLADTVLIRTKDKFEMLESGKKISVAFYLIPSNTDLERAGLMRTDFKFCGWATSE